MILKRIELENFLSFGKPAVELTFTDDEPLWALCGGNGVGKSAVFDGITYALYGEHRGGSHKADQLIRHGANGFRIVLEFEFAGAEYRITRTRAGRSGQRTTQKVERRTHGPQDEWEAISGIDSAADVKEWVARTLGLGYAAFTTSVLLRQGEADKLFSASRDERIAVLKGIIGFERFEEVSRRVHEAALCCGNTLDTLQRQVAAVLPVAPQELTAAGDALAAAERKREDAQTALTAAVQRIEQARQWQALETKRAGLQQQLSAAQQRAADAATIRANKARLDELAAAVPDLEPLVSLRDQIAGLEPKIVEAESARSQTATALEAKVDAAGQARQRKDHHQQQAAESDRAANALGEEIQRGANLLQLTDTMEEISGKLAEYPADVADQLTQAEADEKPADEEKQQASGDLAAANALLQQAEQGRDRFADVKIGVACSQCGQLVDELHAAKERARLAGEIRARQAAVRRLTSAAAASKAALAAARKRRLSLQNDKTEFDKQSAKLAATLTSLTQLGAVADAAELRERLARQRQEKLDAEARAADERTKQKEAATKALRLDGQQQGLADQLRTATDAIRKLELNLAANRASYDDRFARLAPLWQARLTNLDAEAVRQLAVERDDLQASAAARFELLRQDDEKHAEWSKQLEDLQTDLDQIPADARVPVPQAQRHQVEAERALTAATVTRDTAVRARDGLQSRADQCKRLAGQLRTAEREHDVHKKLDQLLGQTGLQRDLVRDAEEQIVELANDTLQNLSGGELSLEPDDEAAGRDDKAFALRARRSGDPLPIGVPFLSGSQKFRVAVSIALAVGRFASGRARPLEAVIIDEGFGSLDKDGLRAMADELKRLQREQSLKRVILVSHQEDFTDQFPVGYRLTAGDNGAMAEPFRR